MPLFSSCSKRDDFYYQRESAHRDAERERRLRADSEARTKQAVQEANRCRSRLKLLTSEFARMEETVRSMLAYKRQAEQLRQEKAALTLAFENRCQQYQNTISRLNQEILTLREQLDQFGGDLTPEGILEAQKAAIQRHAEESRKQYERCLDDVANQVVRALLAQKGLKEEVGNLNNRIQELESQNRALTSMLVHQLRGETPDGEGCYPSATTQIALQDTPPTEPSPTSLMQSSLLFKHCNSFNSEVLEDTPNNDKCDNPVHAKCDNTEKVLTKIERHFSADAEVLAQSSSKSEEETTGNESPESGNRDEGYSTMSSDVQTDVTRSTGEAAPNRGLEDLKEATDETDLTETRLLISDNKDPDILYIPLNLLNLKSRNSYPPGKDMLPFQHIMRSFSDSHLCIKITTSPSPCYTFSSPISSSPSIFLLDICDKSKNPLRRTRATSSLWGNNNLEICDDKMSQLSWSSAADDRLDCTTWDAEYIQHWLRLDETRSALQQQHRDLFELEYDRTELEDWSLSLSSDDLREQSWRKSDAITPGQISISTLPSIQENNALELEEDANECLWNNSSYMMDKEGRELVTLLMDTSKTQSDKQWPYAVPNSASQQVSPDNSWSSGASDCQSHEPETCSKRSSAALSGCSDDTGELPAVGTDFTRDFYRLVKFESTKSLASTSSRSLGGALSENGDRETALQNVLTFIAEQQKYVAAREGKESRPCSVNEMTKDFNIEGPPQIPEELKISITSEGGIKPGDDESCVAVKQACDETSGKKRDHQDEGDSLIAQNIAYAEEICLVTPLDVESENCSNISEHPVDICSSVSVADYQNGDHEETTFESKTEININDSFISDISKSCDTTCSDISICANGSESLTSSVSTPDTVVSKIPRRKATALTPSPTKTKFSNNDTKIPKSKIPYKRMIKSKADSNKVKENIVRVEQPQPDTHVITSEKLPQSTSGVISNIIEGPPHRAVSFHERATSKDVIDELNRMIRNGDDGGAQEQTEVVNASLDHSCRSTGWIHVERDIDLTDPKARANLLDVMMASVSSDSSPTSSCGGSVASDSTEDPPDYGHLHRIHRFHRQKKANAIRPELAVVRATQLTRPTIIGRPDFFVRYGDKEKEAVASFDFLDDLSTTSSSLSCSIEESEDKAKDCYVSLNVSQV